MVGWLILLLFVWKEMVPEGLAQEKQDKRELADEYFKRENFSKALEIYESLLGPAEVDVAVFPNLMTCIKKEKPAKMESTLKRFLKKYPDQFSFQAYQFSFIKENQGQKDLDKFVSAKWIPWMVKTQERVYQGFSFFSSQNALGYRQELLDLAVKQYGFLPFWKLALETQLQAKNQTQASKVVVDLLSKNMQINEELQQFLQEPIQNQDFAKIVQMDVLKQIQAKPTAIQFPEFLAWVYLQIKDYHGALTQYKSLDLLQNTGGTRVFQLAEFALNNEQNQVAIKAFEFIIQQFPQSQYRFLAQQKLIQLREELVKNTYPVQKPEVRELIAEYLSLAQNQYLNFFDLNLKVAELYGKYLNQPDSAINLLEEKLKITRWPKVFESKAKVLKADMYILKNEPWEASLLYGQVEKDEAESLIGYEAKLKNAKVFYFKGEFELCQEQLDVLKMSTSRDISNDAIELGLLLQDVMAEDTTGYFLSKFAEIDLLAYQGNFPASISLIETMTATASNAVVLERLRYRLFKNQVAVRNFDGALQELDQILKAKASDLYQDDALFYSANIYWEQKKDKAKAMELYLQLIKDFPGSVFVVDARKKLRFLRGDSLN